MDLAVLHLDGADNALVRVVPAVADACAQRSASVALRPDDLVNDTVEDGVDSLALTRERKQTMPFFALQHRMSVSFTFIISMICCLQRDTSLCGRSIFVITGMISRF